MRPNRRGAHEPADQTELPVVPLGRPNAGLSSDATPRHRAAHAVGGSAPQNGDSAVVIEDEGLDIGDLIAQIERT